MSQTAKTGKLKRAGDVVPPREGDKPPFGPLFVCAVVFNLKDDREVARHRFDFNDLEKRIWYNEKVIVWAVHHQHSVELFLESDDVT